MDGCGRSQWRPGSSEWSPGGCTDPWSQVPVTLKRSFIWIRIRIRIQVKSWIWNLIRIEVISWIRIRIKVMRIRNPGWEMNRLLPPILSFGGKASFFHTERRKAQRRVNKLDTIGLREVGLV